MSIRVDAGYSGTGPASRPVTNTGDGAKTPAAQPASNENLPAIFERLPEQTTTSGTRVISQNEQALANGYRRTQTYEKTDGSTFTKIEEFALTDRGTRRLVTQQNPSGSITRYEEVLDREGTSSGSFRRTQRFQDASGEVSTQITSGYTSADPYVLSGGTLPPYTQSSPFSNFRGTQLDLQA